MSAAEPLSGRTVVVGVCGGIAAYKAAELVRLLRKAGAAVNVILTAAAQQFITPLTLQALSGRPVATSLFDLTQESQIGHIALADAADLLVVAPATADALARLALGLADDVLTTVALATKAPLLLCPAMNVNMWQHPQVQEHLRRLTERGAETCGPDAGPLACGWVGPGRLVEPAVILEAVVRRLGPAPARGSAEATAAARGATDAADAADAAAGPLWGRRVVVTAGPTYEALDAVRFLGNRSSGKMGFAIARQAALRGARVTLVAGPVALPTPVGPFPAVNRVDVESAAEMAAAVLPLVEDADVAAIVMTAAVADYRPARVAGGKLKKEELGEAPRIDLVQNLDILAELGRRRVGRLPVLVGFAAETQAVEAYAAEKLRRKGCDLLVANDVGEAGSGFGTDTNRVTILQPGSAQDRAVQIHRLPMLAKEEVAGRLLAQIEGLLRERVGHESVMPRPELM